MIEWLNSNQSLVSAGATVVIASFAIVTATLTGITVWLTRTLANENRLIRKAGTQPEVVVYLASDPQRPHNINFVLANVGRGPARNVEFTLEADFSDFEAHGVSSVFTNIAGGKGTDLLPQDERIQSFFGKGPLLLGSPPLHCFNVSLTYEDFSGETHNKSYQLDVAQLDWISWLERAESIWQ